VPGFHQPELLWNKSTIWRDVRFGNLDGRVCFMLFLLLLSHRYIWMHIGFLACCCGAIRDCLISLLRC